MIVSADPRFTPADAALIKRKARRLNGHYGWRRQDLEDIEQDLALHVLQRAQSYRPDRGTRPAFVTAIVKHKILNMIDQRAAAKRGNGRTIHPALWHDEWLRDRRIDLNANDRRIDVRDAMNVLPPELKAIATHLQQGENYGAVGRVMGFSRQEMRGRRARLRSRLRTCARARKIPLPPTNPRANPVVNR